MRSVGNLVGEKYGSLLVLAVAPRRNKGKAKVWLCFCDVCGKSSEVYQGSLTRKNNPVRSCGCLSRKRIGDLKRLESGEAARRRILGTYKKRGASGVGFSLTDFEFFVLTQQNCHYCGLPPSRSSLTKGTHHNGDFIYNGVDRKDSLVGYTVENCVPCCRMCNMGKLDHTYAEFIAHLEQIVKFRGNFCG